VQPLRVGVVINPGASLEPWVFDLVQRLRQDPGFDVCALLVAEARSSRSGSALLGLASKLDAALFARPSGYEMPPEVWRDLPRHARRALTDDPALALTLALDVLIETVQVPDFPDVATYGVWTFDFCDAARMGAFAFWESLTSAPLTPATLLHFSAAGEPGQVIATAAFNTKFSAARNAAYVKARAVSLMVRELRTLAADRRLPKTLGARPAPPPPATSIDTLRYGLHLAGSLAGRAGAKALDLLGVHMNEWAIHVGRGEAPFIDPRATRPVQSLKGQFWADPFLFHEGGGDFLFFENYLHSERRGRISVARLHDDGYEFLGDVLAVDDHLSYPFVFRHDGQIYMMPERHMARRLEIWRCVEFPLRWELHATALEGESPADSVLHHDGSSWWLFTNLTGDLFQDHCSELHVFKVDGPDLTSVEPHRLNPVVIGSQYARNGGRMLRKDGRTFRPAQENSHGVYGYGINVMEVTELTLKTYAEHPVHALRPDFGPGLIGCHHLDSSGEAFVIDVCRRWGGVDRPRRAGLGPRPQQSWGRPARRLRSGRTAKKQPPSSAHGA